MTLDDYVRAWLHHDALARQWHHLSVEAEGRDKPELELAASHAAEFHQEVAAVAEKFGMGVFGDLFDERCNALWSGEIPGQQRIDDAVAERARRLPL